MGVQWAIGKMRFYVVTRMRQIGILYCVSAMITADINAEEVMRWLTEG